MQNRSRHIINKNTLKIEVEDMGMAKKVNTMAQGTTAAMEVTFEEALNACDTGENVIIDKLYIDLTFTGTDDFARNFSEKLKQQLIKAISAQLGTSGGALLPAGHSPVNRYPETGNYSAGQAASQDVSINQGPQKNARLNTIWETVEYYIQYGHFPWWFTGSVQDFTETLEAAWRSNPAAVKGHTFLKLLENPAKFQRFIQVIPENKLGDWEELLTGNLVKTLYGTVLETVGALRKYSSVQVHHMYGWVFYAAFTAKQKSIAPTVENIVPLLKRWLLKMETYIALPLSLRPAFERYAGSVAFLEITREDSVETIIKQIIKQVVITAAAIEKTIEKGTLLKKKKITTDEVAAGKKKEINSPEGEETDRELRKSPGENDILVANAGLVIAWPFFATAYRKLGYLEDNKFKDFHSRQQAVLFLHYLVYNHMPEDESPLYLNKLLCGIEPAEFISTGGPAGEGWAEMRTDLWKAVIQQWNVLGTTSVEGLIDTFIVRNGKVKKAPGGYNVLVERKTLDILLDRLPWPISIIKPAWNNYIITVTW